MPEAAMSTDDTRGVPVDIDRLRAGDPDEFGRWVRHVGPAVRGFLRASGIADVDDILQDVWLRLVRSLSRFDGDEDGLRRLTSTMAYRSRADALRARGRRGEVAVDPQELPHPPTTAEQYDDGAIAALRRQLPEQQALVISLRVFGGLAATEVSRMLGIPDATARSLAHRGLKTMARLLEEQSSSSLEATS